MNTIGNYADALANIDTLHTANENGECVANVIARIDDYCFHYGIPVRLDWMDHGDDYIVEDEHLAPVLGGLTLILEGNAQAGMSSDGEYEFAPLPGYELDIHGAYIIASEAI